MRLVAFIQPPSRPHLSPYLTPMDDIQVRLLRSGLPCLDVPPRSSHPGTPTPSSPPVTNVIQSSRPQLSVQSVISAYGSDFVVKHGLAAPPPLIYGTYVA